MASALNIHVPGTPLDVFVFNDTKAVFEFTEAADLERIMLL